MTDKYEQAIKETFNYLEKCITSQPKKDTLEYLYNLGIDKCFIIENIMSKKGFEVKANYDALSESIIVCPKAMNLPIHLWKDKSRIM